MLTFLAFTQQWNVAKIFSVQRQESLRESVMSFDIVNVDGMRVVWGARYLGLDIPEQVTGIGLFLRLLVWASDHSESAFFLGARPQIGERAVSNLKSRFPTLKVAEWHHGYFWDHEARIVEKIKKHG